MKIIKFLEVYNVWSKHRCPHKNKKLNTENSILLFIIIVHSMYASYYCSFSVLFYMKTFN